MADVRVIGAVAVKVRPDTEGFKERTRRQILDELRNLDIEAEVDIDLDEEGLRQKAKSAKKKIEREMTVSWDADYDSIDKAVKIVQRKLKDLDKEQISFKLNRDDLTAAEELLDDLRGQSQIEMEIVNDEKGYKAVLAKMKALQRERIQKTVFFDTDDNSLEQTIAEYEDKLADLGKVRHVSTEITPDKKGFQKALDMLDAELAKFNTRKFEIELDEDKLREERARLEKVIAKEPIDLKVDWSKKSSLEAARKELESHLSGLRAADMKVKTDQKSLQAAINEINQAIDEIESNDVDLTAAAHTTAAAAQLAYTSRGRFADIFVRVNKRSLALAEGILQSLAGFNTLRSTGKMLENLALNFDKIAIKAGGISAAIAAVTNTLTYMLSATLSIADGVAEVVGLSATLPAAMSALTAAVVIQVAAWQDFGAAVDGDAEALAALPANARSAALSLQGVWDMIQKPVQQRFWDGMGDSMAEVVEVIMPQFRDGLADSAEGAGKFTAGVMDSFKKLAMSDDLKTMFSNLSTMFENASGSAEPFFDAFNTLGLRGSEYLPRFGDWLTEIAERFDNFIQKADANGDINRWIDQGIQSLKDMWKVSGSVIDMFRAMTKVANAAGMGGLSVFADNMRDIADMMLAEPFQSRMSRIFEGAHDGASELNVGLKDLGRTIGEAADFTGKLLTGLGVLGGGLLSGIARAIEQIEFQDGMLDAVDGLNDAVEELEPTFESTGRILGNFASIAADVFRNIAPVINTVVTTLDQGMQRLGPALERISGPLADILNGLAEGLSGPLLAGIELIASGIETLADAPPIIQAIVVAMGGLVALKFGGFFTQFQGGFKKLNDAFNGSKPITSAWQAHTARQIVLTGKTLSSGLDAPIRSFGLGMTRLEHHARRGALGVRKAFGGLGSALGGPWGIALGAATIGLTMFGQAQADAKMKTQELIDTLDQQTGALTDSSVMTAMKQIEEATGGGLAEWLDSIGINAPSAAEALDALGYSIGDAANAALKGGPDFDEMRSKLQQIVDMQNMNRENSGTRSWRDFAADIGYTDEQISAFADGGAARALAVLGQINGDVQAGKDGIRAFAEATSVANPTVESFADALGVLSDESSSADERVRGLKTALDILSGKTPSVDEAQKNLNDSLRESKDLWKDAEGNLIKYGGVVDQSTGKIDTVTEAGSNLYDSLKQVTDQTLATAEAQNAAGVAAPKVVEGIEAARDAWIDQAAASLGGKEAAKAAWDYMIGANPGTIATLLETDITGAVEGYEAAKTMLSDLQGREALIKIAGDNEQLATKYEESMGNMDTLDKVIATAHADLDPKQLEAKRQEVMSGLIVLAKQNPTVRASMDPRIFTERKDQLWAEIDRLNKAKPSPEVRAQTAAAYSQLADVLRLIQGISGQHYAAVHTTYTESGAKPQGYVVRPGQVAYNADGSLPGSKFRPKIRKFADGGLISPKPTSAHIAPSGSYVMYAEESTGGEAFIPLSSAKRTRSTQILGEVAKRFGYSLSRNTESYADGGIRGGSGTAPVFNINNHYPQAEPTSKTVNKALAFAGYPELE